MLTRCPVLLAILVLGLLSPSVSSCFADCAARPGYGIVALDNAGVLLPAPTGHSPGDWEWRPLYVSNNGTFKMPVYPTLVGRLNYWFSTGGWKQRLTTTLPWSSTGLYARGVGPSAVWRQYDCTLYKQINGAAIPNPDLVTGSWTTADYYYNRYAWTGTIPANQLPSQWYLDPIRRMVVESANESYGDLGNWSVYSDVAGIYEGCETAPGAALGAPGVIIYFAFLACEYAAVFTHDNWVKELEEQARIYRSYFAPSEHDYFSLDDPSQGRKLIVRRKVPNYSVPSGVDASVAPARGCIGCFAFSAGPATSTSGSNDTKSKTVTISETFTTATIPYQFNLEPSSEGGSAASKVNGRLVVRLHSPGGMSGGAKWFDIPVAGIEPQQWVPPWAFVTQKDGASSWNGTTDGGTDVAMSFATNGRKALALSWSGELIVRAMDFDVDRFDRIEFVLSSGASGAASGETGRCTARAALQPVFSANIAEAGPWKVASIGESVTFTAEAGALPSNATDPTTYSWTFGDGLTATGQTVTHTYAAPGIYSVLLKTDPNVPTQAPNAALFNDTAKGFSYDTCRVSVASTGGQLSSSDANVTFSNLQIRATSNQLIATWKTDKPTSSVLNWTILPPEFVGPPTPTDAGGAQDDNKVTNHTLIVNGITPNKTYYVHLGGRLPNQGEIIYACHGTSGSWWDHMWTVLTPGPGQPENSVVAQSGVAFTNLRFDAQPGQITARWDTNVLTSARLQAADSAGGPTSREVSDAAYTYSHQLVLNNLSNGKTYYLTVSGKPQGGSAFVSVLRNGNSSWDVVVPLPYSGGSRGADVPVVQWACATPSGSQTKYQARLAMTVDCRFTRRLLPSGSWTTTSWTSGTMDPTWTMATTSGKAYEFAFEVRTDSGAVLRSRSYVHVAQGTPPPPPPPPPPPSAGLGEIHAATLTARDGQMIRFSHAFGSSPVIVTSAVKGSQAVASGAVNNSPTGFQVTLRDANDQPVTGALLSYVAFVPTAASPLRGGCAQYGDGARVNFDRSFSQPPVIICSAQRSGRAVTAAAVNNATGGFTLRLRDLAGGSVNQAWVQWLAVLPPLSGKSASGRKVMMQGQVLQASDGSGVTFSPVFGGKPVVIGSAQGATGALMVGSPKPTKSGASLSIRDHNGRPGSGVWLQWLGVYGAQ